MTVDGSAISYINWSSGQPDNYQDEDGIHIRGEDKKWNDHAVNNLLKFVCSKSVGN